MQALRTGKLKWILYFAYLLPSFTSSLGFKGRRKNSNTLSRIIWIIILATIHILLNFYKFISTLYTCFYLTINNIVCITKQTTLIISFKLTITKCCILNYFAELRCVQSFILYMLFQTNDVCAACFNLHIITVTLCTAQRILTCTTFVIFNTYLFLYKMFIVIALVYAIYRKIL